MKNLTNSNLPKVKRKNDLGFKVLVIFVSTAAAFPLSSLNAFSSLLEGSETINQMNSIHDFVEILKNASILKLSYGAAAFLSSEILLSYLNSKYLIGSSKSVLNLIARDIKGIFNCKVENDNRYGIFLENILLIWSFLTSLIFAEIGSKTLSFLGGYGKIIGFLLNLFVFFATRFSGAQIFFKKWISPDDKNKKINSILINNNEHNSIKNILLKLSKIFGYLLATSSMLPLISCFIPDALEGFNTLFNSKIGLSNNYQSLDAIILGCFITLPTFFFYAVNIKKIPNLVVETGYILHSGVTQNCKKTIAGVFAKTFLTLWLSYFTSIGFKLIADTAIASNYLSYFPKGILEVLPYMLFASVFMMFWSHLQEMSISKNNEPMPKKQSDANRNLSKFNLFSDYSTFKDSREKEKQSNTLLYSDVNLSISDQPSTESSTNIIK